MRFLKAILFYPLLMIRRIVLAVGKVLGGLCVVGGILGWIIDKGSIHWGMNLTMVLLGLGLFVLSQLYDQLLLKLNPTGRDLILFQ